MGHEEFMRRAISMSRERAHDGEGGPFAAVVVKDGEVVGEGWNQVTSHNDPTAHAEVVAIRDACARLGTYALSGAVIYTTCEPCPMCLAAIYWARLDALYFANSTADAVALGFDDGLLYQEIRLQPDQRSLPHLRILSDEALEVFAEWDAWAGKKMY